MTWRIEHTNALTFLKELPAGRVHTCVTLPPCGLASEQTLAVLTEIHRVLRDDGSLWLFLPSEALRAELRATGWVEHPPPSWAAPVVLRSAGIRPLCLLTKRPAYFHRPVSIAPRTPRGFGPRRPGWQSSRPEQGRDAIRGLAGRFVLTTTAHVACGTCGAPYQRERLDERRSTCAHNNPTGRCLVLDPFYRPANGTLAAARDSGRDFLGIVDAGHRERELPLDSALGGRDQPCLVGKNDDLYAVTQLELGEDTADVRLDGRLGEHEPLCDLGV